MTPHKTATPFPIAVPVSPADVFEVFHLLMEAGPSLTGHELWLLAHQIVYPTVHARKAEAGHQDRF